MNRNIRGQNEKVIEEFSRHLRHNLGENLLAIRLFGSLARGDATSESDIDVLLIVKNDDKATREIVINAAVDINLKHDVVISPVLMSEKHYTGPLFRETCFFKSIQEEGISL